MEVRLSGGDIVDPGHDAPDHRTRIPTYVGDGGGDPGEGEIGVGGDQREISGSLDTASCEMIHDGMENEGFVDEQGGRWSEAEEIFEDLGQAFRGVIPFGKVVGTKGQAVLRHLIDDRLFNDPRSTRAKALSLDQNDSFVTEGNQLLNELTSRAFVVGADSGDGELASSAKECEDWLVLF